MTKHDAIKHLSYKIAFAEQYDERWADNVRIDALEIAVRAMAEERKKGKWIDEPNCWYRCSYCKSHYPSIKGTMEYNFCPNCGADMRGDENETN